MYNHAPNDYACPFCLLLKSIKNEHVLSVESDIFYRGDDVTAFISSHQWLNNPGHALVIPNQHYENIYDLPADLGGKVHQLAQQIALAMKAVYGCDGVSTRQHNEPDGNQDVWHYHLHVFPRYVDDNLYGSEYFEMPVTERAQYASRLRAYFKQMNDEYKGSLGFRGVRGRYNRPEEE
jgi:histidine triad (HIT) family protein